MKLQVKQDPEDEVPTEILAKSIEKIANGYDVMNKSRLNKRALLILLRDASGVSMTEIQKVLNGLENLKKLYLKNTK